MMKLPIPRRADGSINVFKLKMRAPGLVDYAAYQGNPKEIAELVMAVTEFQRQRRERVGGAA